MLEQSSFKLRLLIQIMKAICNLRQKVLVFQSTFKLRLLKQIMKAICSLRQNVPVLILPEYFVKKKQLKKNGN
jgi:hypothetical protein